MKDDELTRGIAEALAEEGRTVERDAKWEALTNGGLTADERAELEALAANDPAAADALEAYAPLGHDFEEQIAQSFLASGAAVSRANVAAAPKAARTNESRSKPEPKGGNVFRLGAYVAAPLAIAAGIALFLGQRGAANDALPPYAIALSSNLQAERGGTAESGGNEARIHPKAYFEIVARPSVPPHEPVDARAVLVRNGRAAAWNVPIAISAEGAVRIAGRADALFPEMTGGYGIVVAVAPKSALPDASALVRYAEESKAAPPEVRILRAHVEIDAE